MILIATLVQSISSSERGVLAGGGIWAMNTAAATEPPMPSTTDATTTGRRLENRSSSRGCSSTASTLPTAATIAGKIAAPALMKIGNTASVSFMLTA